RPVRRPRRTSAAATSGRELDNSRRRCSDRAPTLERFVLRSPQGACSSQVLPRHTRGSPYRCSLPGLAGFGDSRCVGPNLQRRPLRLIQHGPPSEWGFDPAEADCGLQGTANSPSSTATSQLFSKRSDRPTVEPRSPCEAAPTAHINGGGGGI